MILIGILGGVASGKSAVSNRLKMLGAVVLDADRAGHEVLREPEVKEALRRRWGDAVFDAAGEVDRRKVAGIVFAETCRGREELAFLEQLTHPRIERRLRGQLEELSLRGVRVAVLDAPVMLKAGWDRMCDGLVFVDTPRHVRLARARQRGWTEAVLAAREAAQEPLETKRRRAVTLIDNSSSWEHLHEQVDRFWRSVSG
ncbi:MAG: dephospho-CoA kinase [Candidatus Anammoximicrobium sp.]|nr:dephospho-CoA kinase [Candidatus Anammoximicrobium sp.]